MDESNAAAQEAAGHGGSASFNLSGRTLLGAWIISIAAHVLILYVLGRLVFPYSPRGPEHDLPAVRAEIVGPVNTELYFPSAPPELDRPVKVTDPDVKQPAPKRFTELSELTTKEKPKLSIVGVGVRQGDLDSFRIPSDMGIKSEFFGVGGSARGARKIVYVVDRSGSMLGTFEYVRTELKRSISALRRNQRFHVIFFNSGPPLENPPRRLVNAIGAQKKELFEFLDTVMPRGETRPGRAMRLALSLKPDLIYLLSDGIDFRPSLLRKLDEWNRKRRTRIFTIAYLDRTGSELLEQIAREHNGDFKFVSEFELP